MLRPATLEKLKGTYYWQKVLLDLRQYPTTHVSMAYSVSQQVLGDSPKRKQTDEFVAWTEEIVSSGKYGIRIIVMVQLSFV